MKNIDILYKSSKNTLKLLSMLNFSVFLLNCFGGKFQGKDPIPPQPIPKSHVVFSNTNSQNKLSIYSEKFSQKGSVLVLKQGPIFPNAIYGEFILSSISPHSIKVSKSIFKADLPKYSLSEKMYYGSFVRKERVASIEVGFERVLTRTRFGNDLESLLDANSPNEILESEVIEKIVFIPKKEFSLWKSEEWVMENKKPFLWRNFEEGTGVLSKISFTEFVSPLGNLYSKIQSPNEYIFGYLKDANPITVFSFYDFEITMDINQFIGDEKFSQGINPPPNFKNSLPKLYIRKILNTNGN
jgi:hypothetical protein